MWVREQRRETGAVLPLLAILSVTIIAIVAITVELVAAGTASEQAKQFARIAALAAISEYYQSLEIDGECASSQDSHDCAMQAALNRVQSLSDRNRLLGASGSPAVLTQDPGSDGGLLEAGFWGTDDDSADELPTFRSIDIDQGERPNAFRISGQFYPEGVNLNFASRLNKLGFSGIVPRVRAVSTFVPRRGCFLIDISPSIVYETHMPWTNGGPYLDPPLDPPGGPDLDQAFGNQFGYLLRSDHQKFNEDGSLDYELYLSDFPRMDMAWEELNNDPGTSTRPGDAPWDPVKHYASDYRTYFILSDDLYSSLPDEVQALHPDPDPLQPGTERYRVPEVRWPRVDSYIPPEDPDRGPEPMTTIINGIRQAVEQFRDRRIPGDQACLIFFDQTTPWSRVVQLTNNFQYLIDFLDYSMPEVAEGETFPPDDSDLKNENDYSDIRLIANFLANQGGAGEGRIRAIRHGVLPERQSFTDIREALQEAMLQLDLSEEGQIPSSQFMVIVTDGLQNCRIINQVRECNNQWSHYSEGMVGLLDMLERSQGDRKIPIHVIFESGYVGPHTVDLFDNDFEVSNEQPRVADQGDNCLTDDEYRRTYDAPNFNFVRGQGFKIEYPQDTDAAYAFSKMSVENPFFQANKEFYRIAVATQGLWGPLRPRSEVCDSLDEINQDGYLDPRDYRPLCGPSPVPPGDDEPVTEEEVGRRRMTDPYCRTKSQQMRSYLNRIIGENPFTIVQVESS